MKQTLYIMQGVPGSGKSTIAKTLSNDSTVVFSTDDLFMVDGVYQFDPNKLGEYHRQNFERCVAALNEGKSVIVDNTNIRRWQCKEYVKFAVERSIAVVFIRVTGNFQTVHGVPPEKIELMRSQMEDLTVDSVLAS